jgi:hypothetical protein
MTAPKKLKIVGQNFKVSFLDTVLSDEGDKVQGLMSSQHGSIKVRKSRPFLEVDTLIHEIFHAIEYKVGLEFNEHWVSRVATGLTQVFVDNPKLLEYIQQRLKEDENDY